MRLAAEWPRSRRREHRWWVRMAKSNGSKNSDSASKEHVAIGRGDSDVSRLASLVLVLIVFVLALLPYCANFVVHHPDERHYTDGAITMLKTGDYITPVTPQGNFRFHKPILTYWLVAGSYHLLGVSVLASRLPFLLTGAALVITTFGTAKALFKSSRVGLLAAAVIACHPIVLISSTRSIPDILLTLFMLVSAYGFIQIICLNDERDLNYYLAYVGAGLAFASKGLPALALVVFAWVFGLVTSNPRWSIRRLLHWPSMTLGAAIGAAWFVAVLYCHGLAAFRGFWGDQVTGRMASEWWKPMVQYPAFVLLCVALILPWAMPFTVPTMRRNVWKRMSRSDHDVARFILLWSLLFAVFGAMVTKFSSRYVLPVSPLLCMLVALGLWQLDRAWLNRWLRYMVIFAFGAAALVWIASLQMNTQIGWSLVTVCGLGFTLVVLLACLLAGLRLPNELRIVPIGIIALSVLPTVYFAIGRLAVPDQGQQIADCLTDQTIPDRFGAEMICKPALASKTRVCSSGALLVRRVKEAEALSRSKQTVPLIVERDLSERLEKSPNRLIRASHGFQDLDPASVLLAYVTGGLSEYLDQRRQQYWVIMPDSHPANDQRLSSRLDSREGPK